MKDFNFTSKYCKVNNIRIHYIDEGSETSPVIFLLHGVPSWSYIYRNIIPICIEKGYRVIVPDIPGFGLSEIPNDNSYYRYSSITKNIKDFIVAKDLVDIVFFGQDWGAVIGMCLGAEAPERFKGLIFSNGLLIDKTIRLPIKLKLWKLFARFSPFLPIGGIINIGSINYLPKDIKDAYNHPFKGKKSKIAVRKFPQLIYSNPMKNPDFDYVNSIWKKLYTLNIPVLTAFSDSDPFTKGGEKIIQLNIPGAIGQNHTIIKGGHFVQEDAYNELGKIITDFALRLHLDNSS